MGPDSLDGGRALRALVSGGDLFVLRAVARGLAGYTDGPPAFLYPCFAPGDGVVD